MTIKKKPGENKNEFISRCVAIETQSGKDKSQAAAICYTYWEDFSLEEMKKVRCGCNKLAIDNRINSLGT